MSSHTFEYGESDFIQQTAQWVDRMAPQESEFDKQLFQRWQAAMDSGAFRYDVDHIQIRAIPGPKKYVALLNILRGTERRKPQQITSIEQPVNPDAFNFTKVKSSEIVFDLIRKETQNSTNGTVMDDGETRQTTSNEECTSASHTLMINNSPINKGHCLLVPEASKCNPQILTETAWRVGLETILLSHHRGFCLGFNSLLAFASVNHQHWHILYIPQQIMVHHCPVRHLAGRYYEVTTFPVHGFVLQLHGASVGDVARQAHQISSYLHENDVAHNAFICRGVVFGEEATSSLTTVRLFIWPRKKFLGDITEQPFNLACVELPGFLPIKYPKAYETFTETDIDAIFKENSLDPSEYKAIRDHIITLGSQNKPNLDRN